MNEPAPAARAPAADPGHVGIPGSPDAPHLPYGVARSARTSILAWVGLAFAVVGALIAAGQVMVVAREAGSNVRFAWTLPAHHLLPPLLGILLAGLGWRRRSRRWPAAAILIAVLSILTLVLLSSRTWGKPVPGGEGPWHRPSLEWTG